MYNKIPKIILAVLLTSLINCSFKNTLKNEQLYTLSSKVIPLTKFLKGYVLVNYSPNLTEEELLKEVSKKQPDLIKPFKNYKLKLKWNENDVVILVCSKKESKAIVEDVSCTPELDKHHWENTNELSCKFTIDIDTICKIN